MFFRTNNNTDNTKIILQEWIEKQTEWNKIILEDEDVPEKVQEWNSVRFKVLAKLRQEGIQKAIDLNVDNFLIPDTLDTLVNLNVPLLRYANCEEDNYYNYSNFHHPVSNNGYFVKSSIYYDILNQKYCGLHQVELVHCTYLIRKDIFDKVYYQDGTADYEYVIFGRCMRKHNIPQLIDNRRIYGCLTLTDNNKAWKNYNLRKIAIS